MRTILAADNFLKNKFHTTLGFTLIEILISIILVSILAGLSAPLMSFTIEAIDFHFARMDMDQSSNLAMARLSREIRRIRDDASVVSATAAQFEFVNLDGNQIRYTQAVNSITRTENAGVAASLADHVQSLTFTYYDDSNAVIGAPLTGLGINTNIRRVQIHILFQDGTETLPIELQVQPRNLRHVGDLFA